MELRSTPRDGCEVGHGAGRKVRSAVMREHASNDEVPAGGTQN